MSEKGIILPPMTSEQRLLLLRKIFEHSEVALRGLGEAREHLIKEIGPDHALIAGIESVISHTQKNVQRAAEIEMMIMQQAGSKPTLN